MIHRTVHRRLIQVDVPDASGQFLSQWAQLIVVAAGVLLLFYCARSVVLPILLALVGSMALKLPVTWLRQHHVPAPLAAMLILALLAAGVAGGLIHFGRPVAQWVKSAPETFPRLREKYHHLFAPISRMTSALYSVGGAADDLPFRPAAPPPEPAGTHIAGTLFTWTGSVLAGVCETAVLLFLLLASGDGFIDKIAHVMPTRDRKKDAVELCRQIQQNISTYLCSVSLINIVFGTMVGATLSCIGLPNAGMWGAVAAVANFVPYFGPVAGVMAVAGAGLLAFDTVGRGLLPAGVYLLWHLLEADLVTPWLLGRRFRINPFVIFVVLMFFAWLWGVVGTLLAMPLLVTLNVVCSRVPALSPVAEFLSA